MTSIYRVVMHGRWLSLGQAERRHNTVCFSRAEAIVLGGEVAGSLGGVGREAPFLPRWQGGGHQAGVREPASIGQTTSSPSRCSARHDVFGLASQRHQV